MPASSPSLALKCFLMKPHEFSIFLPRIIRTLLGTAAGTIAGLGSMESRAAVVRPGFPVRSVENFGQCLRRHALATSVPELSGARANAARLWPESIPSLPFQVALFE